MKIDISAANTFSDPVVVRGDFAFSLSGTWVATVHLQRSFDSGVTWLDVDNFTANVELNGNDIEPGMHYRVGVKTGNFTSGTVTAQIAV